MKFTTTIVYLLINVITNTNLKTQKPGILLKGWFKYIIITPSKTDQDFEINEEFDVEAKSLNPAEREQQDEVGFINIPDEHSFYCVLTQNSLNILSSRRNQITKTEDVLDLNAVMEIKQATDAQGNEVFREGLEDMGEFDEGKCFRLKLKTGVT